MNKTLLRKLTDVGCSTTPLANEYTRRDVFRCSHDAHRHFDSAVSVYHVLKVKNCFPGGCIYFRWKCKKLNKGEPCLRKYRHVGKNCTSCRYFYDEKIIKQPHIILSPTDYARFQRDLKRFESWIKEKQGRLVEFSGTVNSVKPRFSLRERGKHTRVVFEGFLLNFHKAAICNRMVDDFVYLPVSKGRQARWAFAKGDMLYCRGTVTIRHGALVLQNLRDVEVIDRGERCYWTAGRALVAQRTGAVLAVQSEKCYACDKGILLEVLNEGRESRRTRRIMFCLEGIQDPRWCPYRALASARKDTWPVCSSACDAVWMPPEGKR